MAPCAAYSGPGGQEPNDSSMPANSAGFGGLERYVADRAQDSEGGSRDDWLQVPLIEEVATRVSLKPTLQTLCGRNS